MVRTIPGYPIEIPVDPEDEQAMNCGVALAVGSSPSKTGETRA